MDQGYKHFSHLHNLIMHEMPEGVEVSCSGCHSSAIGTVYVCWQCNFFLHEQCYRATRTFKHPSHPLHPLTLVPYPTYLSNSFYCNSCEIIGTGFSYSCAECEFDLHVQCAYSISRVTSIKNANLFQELVPQRWNGMQDSNVDHHVPASFTGAQNHYIPPDYFSGVQYHSMNHNQNSTPEPSMSHKLASVSIPTSYPQNMTPSGYGHSMPQEVPPVSIPTSSYDRIPSAQYPPMAQTGPSVSIPTNYLHNPIPSTQDPSAPQNIPPVSIPTNYPQNPIPSTQDPSAPDNIPHVSIPSSSQNSRVQYPSIDQTDPSVSIPTSYQQNPIPSVQDPSAPQTRPHVSIPTSHPHNPNPSVKDSSMPQNTASDSMPTSSHNSGIQYPSMDQTGPPVSIPTNYPQNPNPSVKDSSMPQNKPSDSIPTSSLNSGVQYPSRDQTGPPVSIPTNYSHNPIPSAQDPSAPQIKPSNSIPTNYQQNPVPSVQDPLAPQNIPHVSIPSNYPQDPNPSMQDPLMPQNRHSDSIPTSSHNSGVQYSSMDQATPPVSIPTNYSQNPIPSVQDPSTTQNKHFVSIPTNYPHNPIPSAQNPLMPQNGSSDSIPTNYPQNPIPSAQDPSAPQTRPPVFTPTSSHNSIVQYPPKEQIVPSVSTPTNYPVPSAQDSSSVHQNGLKDKELMHFSHPHKLSRVNLQEAEEDEENEVICSGCEETLVGNGYSCLEPDCNFHLHESCFHLKREIHHKSHPEHPLNLLPRAPYNNENGEFTCSACFSDGTGFTYHCSICKFDLHVQCVSLPESVKREDHEHVLKLFYSCPLNVEDHTFSCDVCHGEVQKDRWAYYCESCDYGTHLGCVDCEECERDSILDTQAQLQRLQLQMQMASQQAQFMANLGSSMSSLAGLAGDVRYSI